MEKLTLPKYFMWDEYNFYQPLIDEEGNEMLPHHLSLFTHGVENIYPAARVYFKKLRKALIGQGYKIPVVLGYSRKGELIVRDLIKIPHLLVAGATGSGKSCFLTNFLLCQFVVSHPFLAKVLILDAQGSSFGNFEYNGVVSVANNRGGNAEQILLCFDWIREVHELRNRLLHSAKRTSIEAYNELAVRRGQPMLTYLLVIFDEFHTFPLSKGEKKEKYSEIVELISLTRKTGIHFVFATQTPYNTVINGLLKANLRGRVCFQVDTTEASFACFGDRRSYIGEGELKETGELHFRIGMDEGRAKAFYFPDFVVERICKNVSALGLNFSVHGL